MHCASSIDLRLICCFILDSSQTVARTNADERGKLVERKGYIPPQGKKIKSVFENFQQSSNTVGSVKGGDVTLVIAL